MSKEVKDSPENLESSGPEQREAERVSVNIQVDCHDEKHFLFASIKNLSELGIFVETHTPAPSGTELTIEFVLPVFGAKVLATGIVVWINPYRENEENLNPGMGIQFTNLSDESREKICDLIRRIAYLADDEEPKN